MIEDCLEADFDECFGDDCGEDILEHVEVGLASQGNQAA